MKSSNLHLLILVLTLGWANNSRFTGTLTNLIDQNQPSSYTACTQELQWSHSYPSQKLSLCKDIILYTGTRLMTAVPMQNIEDMIASPPMPNIQECGGIKTTDTLNKEDGSFQYLLQQVI